MQEGRCPFCEPSPNQIFYRGPLVLGLWDGFPVTKGHALLVTRRCIASWFDASKDEQAELLAAVATARKEIEKRTRPHGYNIGVNVGAAAGQTVPHLHVHVIPRYTGDVHDPRGGVRWVIPEKANYLVARDSAGQGGLASLEAYGQAAAADAAPLLSTGEAQPLWPLLETDLAKAGRLDIAVAFVMPSGVERLYPHLEEHVSRGGSLRLVTGDYLDICDPDALQRLLDLQELHPREKVQLRVFVANGQSFHPKSYVLTDRADAGIAYVGSSNLSASALEKGIEWNFRVMAARDPRGFQTIREAFESLFLHPKTREIDAAWLREYRLRRRPPVTRGEATPDAVAEPSLPAPVPNSIQQQALDALSETRQRGFRAGLVVLPTGLGKTWLAAFDSNRPEFRRILFVAHRDEILNQALATFRRISPGGNLGRYTGDGREAEADILFASIQTLGNPSHLERFAPDAFDYVVVDEFHHAAATTYRRLIEHFEPRFLLGLTATPERTDGGSLLALCQENLVFRADVMQGIREELLCPFHYFGVPDEIDYSAVKWTGDGSTKIR
jgi:diadenosine tetraphosphate (Ap4A) HIT family hydrolase/HKD family nuclease